MRENISYGAPNASEDAIVAAAQAARAHDFVTKLPNGYDTHIEERGVNLSGGQKQRVSIARAIIKDPEILLFDDCLSAVDTETEEAILNNLNEI